MNIALKPLEVAYQQTASTPKNQTPFEFADFLRQQLRWRKVSINQQQGSFLTAIAERQNRQGQALSDLAILLCAVSIGFIIIGYAMGYDSHFSDGTDYILSWSGGVLLAAMQVFILIARHLYREKAWVGTDYSSGKTGLEEIEKNLRMYWKYAANSGKPYNFTAHYFVSANGYTLEALEYAFDNNIACYEIKNGQFETVRLTVTKFVGA
jgi:hypothetical protein